MTVIKQDNVEPRKLSKARRKEISARYYQRHRKIIKLAMTLDISMKEARAMHAREAAVKSKNPALMPPTALKMIDWGLFVQKTAIDAVVPQNRC